MRANLLALVALTTLALITGGCQSEQQRESERRHVQPDSNSAAFKAGQAAHKIATEAERVAEEAGRKLNESARKAREGWKDEERKGPK